MASATFHFHDDLNYFLPAKRRNTTLSHNFDGHVSVKDIIESLGVPHPEIEAIVVNAKRAVDFSYLVADQDTIEVYAKSSTLPAFVTLNSLRPALPDLPSFVLDAHLGQLATYFRMLGFDTLYRNDYDDEELAYVSSTEGRILLSRDLGLLKRSIVIYGYFVRETNPKKQVIELLGRFHLENVITPLKRCIRCNGELKAVDKASIVDRLEPKTRELFDQFSLCTNCDQVYWKGSHYEPMQSFIAEVLGKTHHP